MWHAQMSVPCQQVSGAVMSLFCIDLTSARFVSDVVLLCAMLLLCCCVPWSLLVVDECCGWWWP
jgi:hypothetical protein